MPAKPLPILLLTIAILAAALLGCQDLDIDRRGFQATATAAVMEEAKIDATAMAGADARERDR